jgi:ATP-dependent helicase HrpB
MSAARRPSSGAGARAARRRGSATGSGPGGRKARARPSRPPRSRSPTSRTLRWNCRNGAARRLELSHPAPEKALTEARALLTVAGRAGPRGSHHTPWPRACAPAAPPKARPPGAPGRDPARRGLPPCFGPRPDARRGCRRRPGPTSARARQRRRARRCRNRRAHPGGGQAPETARGGPRLSPGAQASLAYPDRIGLRRKGDAPRYLLSGGAGAALPEGDPMGQLRLIVATDLDGDRREGRIRGALPLTEGSFAPSMATASPGATSASGPRATGRVEARRQETLDALVLDDRRWDDPPPETVARALATASGRWGWRPWAGAGLPPAARAHPLCRGRGCLGRGLLDSWRTGPPYLDGIRDAAGSPGSTPAKPCAPCRLAGHGGGGPARPAALDVAAGPQARHRLRRRHARDRGAPAGGSRHHPPPDRGTGRLPIRMVLLSPASRPIQVTTDLPGFWSGSYADVRKDMRAQYPRHPWPEDPTTADPTLRAKPPGGPLTPSSGQISRGAPHGGGQRPHQEKETTRSVTAGSRRCAAGQRYSALGGRRPRAGVDALGRVAPTFRAWRATNHRPAPRVSRWPVPEASVM